MGNSRNLSGNAMAMAMESLFGQIVDADLRLSQFMESPEELVTQRDRISARRPSILHR